MVCTQLAYRTATNAFSNAAFGAADASQPIWLDNVACTGSEAALSDCDFNGWGDHNCAHSEDAGVACEGELGSVCVEAQDAVRS